MSSLIKWFHKEKKIRKINVKVINEDQLLNWKISDSSIYHLSKSFFKIEFFKFLINKIVFFQPLIIQKDIGILGIIKKVENNKDYYLLQSKVEPGNINKVQISPTVQATASNYKRKHGGKKTNYLKFFLNINKNATLISRKKLSEHGNKFYQKKNENFLIEVSGKVKKLKSFEWFSKNDIVKTISKNNILNMDTLSVFSNNIKKIDNNYSLNSLKNIIKLTTTPKNLIKRNKINLSKLKNWKKDKTGIYDIKKKLFKIKYVLIETNSREINSWTQPIISNFDKILNIFIVKDFNGVRHYLLKSCVQPGFNHIRLTNTISMKMNSKINYDSHILRSIKKKPKLVNSIYSDEGGRFFKNQVVNQAVKLGKDEKIKLKKNYVWVSHNQMINLINRDIITIEARILFAICNINKII